MTNIIVDIESDGQCPGKHSMICFGAVILDEHLDKTFYGELRPISSEWEPDALAISGFTREETLLFPEPEITLTQFDEWISEHCKKRPTGWSDNNSYDFGFLNYYFWQYLNKNPFGFSSQNINSLYKGLTKDCFASFKHLRKTKHTHNPVDDAMGNAEALLEMRKMGIKIPMK